MRSRNGILKLAGAAGLIGVIAATAGCGGGGGSSAPNTGIPAGLTTLAPGVTSTLPAGGALLPLVPGDEWYYAINGYTNTGTTIKHITRASYMRTINDGSSIGEVPLIAVPNAPAGAPGTPTDPVAAASGFETLTGIGEQWNIVYNDDSQTNTSLTTYVTPLNTSYNEWADDGDDLNLESTGNDQCETFGQVGDAFTMPLIPLTFGLGTAISGGSSLNVPSSTAITTTPPCAEGGTVTGQENRTFTVVGTSFVTVTVPAGTFQTWKVTSSEVSSINGSTENDTAYWAPQIGTFVQQQATISHSNGSVDNFTYQLVGFKTIAATVYSRIKKK